MQKKNSLSLDKIKEKKYSPYESKVWLSLQASDGRMPIVFLEIKEALHASIP